MSVKPSLEKCVNRRWKKADFSFFSSTFFHSTVYFLKRRWKNVGFRHNKKAHFSRPFKIPLFSIHGLTDIKAEKSRTIGRGPANFNCTKVAARRLAKAVASDLCAIKVFSKHFYQNYYT